MAFAPLRFLHAADARLDQAIGEIPRLPPRLESIVRDATRAAFDRCVALAIDHEVDFVCWPATRSWRTIRAFPPDCRCSMDSSSSIAAELECSSCPVRSILSRLGAESPTYRKTSRSWDRDRRELCRSNAMTRSLLGSALSCSCRRKKARTLRDDLRSASQRAIPFKIAAITAAGEIDDTTLLGDWCPDSQPDGTATAGDQDAGRLAPTQGTSQAASGRRLPVDYVALGGGTDRRTFARRRGIAHDPGPMQGRGPDQSGPRGCTLVTVEQDGTVRCDFLPTASVRWEQFRVGVPVPFDRAELLARCRARLDEVRPEPCENARILQWILHGGRPAIDALDDESFRRQLRQDLANATAVPSSDDSMHQLVVEADEDSVDAVCHGRPTPGRLPRGPLLLPTHVAGIAPCVRERTSHDRCELGEPAGRAAARLERAGDRRRRRSDRPATVSCLLVARSRAMRITKIEVDRFGVWRQLALPVAPRGLTVFYGPNEAGKTTLWRFICSILYGFEPFEVDLEGGTSQPVRWEGALQVEAEAAHYSVHRVSDRGTRGLVSVVGTDRQEPAESLLTELLFRTNEALFENVFAVGLNELQELATLEDDEVAHHIYGLTLGPTGQKLLDATRALGSQGSAILDPATRSGRLVDVLERDQSLSEELDAHRGLREEHAESCARRSRVEAAHRSAQAPPLADGAAARRPPLAGTRLAGLEPGSGN